MFPDDKVDFIWFTDEKVFTVSSPRNPVDYKIWGIVQQRVYQSRIHDVDQLKQRLLDVWHGMEQNVVDNAIDEWRVRLRACVRARGGHFEQTL